MNATREQLSLPPTADAPARARAFLTEYVQIRHREAAACLADGTVVVSELVSNVVRHAGTPMTVELAAVDDGLAVAVADSGAGFPNALPTDLQRTSGRGLALVAQLGRRWGVQYRRGGKTVWCLLRPSPAAQSRRPTGLNGT